ncbi:MAG: sigma-E factor negative regulatory protein [Methylococcales bacterium]
MQEELDIKISMLLDDELESREALEMFTRIRNESALRAKWLRYNAASCAFRGRSASLPDSGFFDRVSKALDGEVQVVRPGALARKKPLRMTSLAVALAVVGVVVWSGISSLNNPGNHFNPVSLIFSTQTEVRAPLVPVESKPSENPALPGRLSDYLITHNESTYTTGAPTMMPFARVVSFSDGR